LQFRLKKLLIPAFPLGALLALGLFGVGFVFAFPDDEYVWLWELVIAIAIILWVVGAGLFASLLPDNVKETPEGDKKSERPLDERKENGLSRSFSAIVDAINAHSRANVAEERQEDYGRGLRETVTIVLLAITMIAIIFQVIEMRKVYEPIRNQAELMQNNMVADHRAWIGPSGATIGQPIIDKPISAKLLYNNTGRQPAPLVINVNIIPYTYEEWTVSGAATAGINAFHDSCFNEIFGFKPSSIAFPGLSANEYQYNLPDSGVTADQSVLAGDKVVVVLACFSYKSYNTIRHTSYCGFDLSGTTVSTTLSYCPVGNDAD
jgi:hypothetical protein